MRSTQHTKATTKFAQFFAWLQQYIFAALFSFFAPFVNNDESQIK